jgi:hypothetical protein
MYNDTQLTNKVTVAQMTVGYNSAMQKVEQGYKLLESAQQELENVFGKDYGNFDTIDRYNIHRKAEENIKYIKDKTKKGAWKHIIDILGIRKVLSIKKGEEFDKKFEEGKNLPEITDAAIFDMMQLLTGQAKEFATEAVKEVFDYLRPGASDHNKLKTNKKYAKYELGKKVILSSVVEHGFGSYPFRVAYYYGRENRLIALDRVFSVLDGKSWDNSYKSPLVDAINTSETGSGETEYFKFRACHNGNLHLEFKRMDLVQKMNQIAGNEPKLRGN